MEVRTRNGAQCITSREPCVTNLALQVRGSTCKCRATALICMSRGSERSQEELWEGQAIPCPSGSPWYYRCCGDSRGKSSGRVLGMHGFPNSCQCFQRALWREEEAPASAGGAGWQDRCWQNSLCWERLKSQDTRKDGQSSPSTL